MRDLLKRHMFLDAVIVQLCCRIFIQCPEGGSQLFFCQNLSMGVLVKLFSSISNPVPHHPGEQAALEAGRPVVSVRGARDGSTFRLLNRPARTESSSGLLFSGW